ncbi:hypothetical protein BOTBODRAFT_29844 [Botryobasidium botryosum FD-172 SS1]|uniref:Autophagy-related protein 14 n=1 Tax=Botryobasidium botryosum (strain FD-172 SS1) TaxID=930990 RepID=A0A067N0I7_BOTB1|nr:hypothetical protein BOTBODRAFT_29844 [Botryobasidium botryosum FD-172 SS1]
MPDPAVDFSLPYPTSVMRDQPHRIRHITGVQIRNLTPFPHRDRAATALQLPVSPMRKDRHAPDDIDIALARRRTRRTSTTSITATRSITLDAVSGEPAVIPAVVVGDVATTPRPTMRRNPKRSFHVAGPSASSAAAAADIARRARSSSRASIKGPPSIHLGDPSHSTAVPIPDSLPYNFDTSQRHLEKIFASRLVETFVVLSTPAAVSPSPTIPEFDALSGGSKTANHVRSPSAPTKASSRGRASLSRNHTASSTLSPTPDKSASGKPTTNGDLKARPPNLSPSVSFPTSKPASSRGNSPSRALPPQPIYVSPPHRPSTNPAWSSLDWERDFFEWADTRGAKLHVAVWGRVGQAHPGTWTSNSKGKEKEKAFDPNSDDELGFKVLEEWDVDLDDLERLGPELIEHPELVAPNTLILSLGPKEELYRVPPLAPPSPRPSTPTGHISDGEVDVRTSPLRGNKSRLSRVGTSESTVRGVKVGKTSSWQQLVRLVKLQSDIIHEQESLDRTMGRLLDESGITASRREVSEREAWIEEIGRQTAVVRSKSSQTLDSIRSMRENLQKRRETLASARQLLEADEAEENAGAARISQLEDELAPVLAALPPRQRALLRAVDFIFPIEPISAGDLLFSILDIPLPIPVNSSDPAPPLTLPEYPSVNEDSIATALGYVAQITLLVSLYTGRILPYPITCAGSKSSIKDLISSMHGPRVFPLFSKGVDTYRFEYAVYLLNKDIEILMVERNLRAMDMRHTLLNLKNLILTLTTGDEEESPPPPKPSALSTPKAVPLSLAELATPPDSPSPHVATAIAAEEPTTAATATATTTIGRASSGGSRSGHGHFFSRFLRSGYSSLSRPASVIEAPAGEQPGPGERTAGLEPEADAEAGVGGGATGAAGTSNGGEAQGAVDASANANGGSSVPAASDEHDDSEDHDGDDEDDFDYDLVADSSNLAAMEDAVVEDKPLGADVENTKAHGHKHSAETEKALAVMTRPEPPPPPLPRVVS